MYIRVTRRERLRPPGCPARESPPWTPIRQKPARLRGRCACDPTHATLACVGSLASHGRIHFQQVLACRLTLTRVGYVNAPGRSEEHTSELQSLRHLVCRLLLEKKNINKDL